MAPAGRRSEAGFTLVEVLVVVLIIGILAAIALPTFLSQRMKGQDTEAKHDLRNVAGVVEACNAGQEDYAKCITPALLRPDAVGVDFGSGSGEVEVDAPSKDTYTMTFHSRSGTGFVLARVSANTQAHTCDRAGRGGCRDDGTW